MLAFLGLDGLAITLCLTATSATAGRYYVLCALLGLANGYWVLFITNAAEQFGTNLRATVATAAPNLIRGSTILITNLFLLLGHPLGVIGSAALVGGICLGAALVAVLGSAETFGKRLDYLET
jgi:hypothetical protein